MTNVADSTFTATGGRFGHGSGGQPGMNLQNAPVVNGQHQQSYILGMPSAKMPLRPMANQMEDSGTPVEWAAGQPDHLTWDTRQTAADPRYGSWNGNGGWADSGNAKQPGNAYGGDPQGKVGPLMPQQETNARPGDRQANDKLVTRDRHVFFKVGYENSGRGSGVTDPPMDGPPRPALASINRTINWQQGTVYAGPANGSLNTMNGNVDDLARPYPRDPHSGMFIGEQGSGWTPVNGGVPGLYQPYGSYAGITAGPVKGIQSPVEQGAPGDGPRKIWGGPPHGIHSPTLPDYVNTLGYYMAMPAQRAPRQDRPDNSTSSGQSFSQLVQPQGQTGTVQAGLAGGVKTSNVWNKVRYAPGGGWRGMVGGIS